MPHLPPRTVFWSQLGYLLRRSPVLLRAAGWRLIGLILLTQLIIMLIAFPVLRWLFAEALRASGMHGLDTGKLLIGAGLPLTMTLMLVIVFLAFLFIALQFTAIVELIRPGRTRPSPTEFLGDLVRIARKLVRPSSLPLLVYLFLLLPLTGFGFTSAFSSGIAIPPFVSGELTKSPGTAAALIVLLLLLAFTGIRLAFTMPLFILTDRSGWGSLRTSWRLTRGVKTPAAIVGAALLILLAAGILMFTLVVVAIVPTAITDELAPASAVTVAAFSFGVVQLLAIIVTGIVTASITAVLIAGLEVQRLDSGTPTAGSSAPIDSTAPGGSSTTTPALARQARSKPAIAAAVIGGGLAVAVAFGFAQIPAMQHFSEKPSTYVLAHRGFTAEGVENTLSGLEAAARAGADLVEMDVMQTADGKFVVMHDANLKRLAGQDLLVKQLTQEQLTAITVSDLEGHHDRIPTLAAYVTRAAELEMPLLIEIKLGGLDSPDHVELLVQELESLGALDSNIFHSLDAASVETLKRLRPQIGVGYIMPFAAEDVPDTPADFIVVEQWSASRTMQDAASRAGLGFFVWTLNDDAGIREFLRRDIDAMVTDHPDWALDARSRDERRDRPGRRTHRCAFQVRHSRLIFRCH